MMNSINDCENKNETIEEKYKTVVLPIVLEDLQSCSLEDKETNDELTVFESDSSYKDLLRNRSIMRTNQHATIVENNVFYKLTLLRDYCYEEGRWANEEPHIENCWITGLKDIEISINNKFDTNNTMCSTTNIPSKLVLNDLVFFLKAEACECKTLQKLHQGRTNSYTRCERFFFRRRCGAILEFAFYKCRELAKNEKQTTLELVGIQKVISSLTRSIYKQVLEETTQQKERNHVVYNKPKTQMDSNITTQEVQQTSTKSATTIITAEKTFVFKKTGHETLDTLDKMVDSSLVVSSDNLSNRWAKLSSFDITTDIKPGHLKTFILPEEFYKCAGVPTLAYFKNHAYGRFDIKLRVVINATKYHTGKFIVTYMCDAPDSDGIFNYTRSAVTRPHMILDVSKNTTGEIEIPFVFHRPWLVLGDNAATPGLTTSQLVWLQIYALTPLRVGNTGQKDVTCTIFYALKNTHFTGIIHERQLTHTQMDIVDAIVPSLSSVIKPFENMYKQIVKSSNQDFPSSYAHKTIIPSGGHSLSTMFGNTSVTTLRADPRMLTNYENVTVDSSAPKTTLNIAQQWGILEIFNWNTDMVEGTSLLELNRFDLTTTRAHTSVIDKKRVLSPVEYISRMYQFYGGSLEFCLEIDSSAYHTGALTFAAVYNTKETPNSCSSTASSYTKTYILNEQNTVRFTLPHIHDSLYYRNNSSIRKMNFIGSDPEWFKYENNSIQSESNINLSIKILNQLRSPEECSPTVTCVLYVRAGADFRLHTLRSTNLYPVKMDNYSENWLYSVNFPGDGSFFGSGWYQKDAAFKPDVNNQTMQTKPEISAKDTVKEANANTVKENTTQMDAGDLNGNTFVEQDSTFNFKSGPDLSQTQDCTDFVSINAILKRPTYLGYLTKLNFGDGPECVFQMPLTCLNSTLWGIRGRTGIHPTMMSSPASMITSLYRYWRGSVRLTLVTNARSVFYVIHYPHSGGKILGPEPLHRFSDPLGDGCSTSLVDFNVNAIQTFEFPYSSELTWTTNPGDELPATHTWRDLGDNNAGHISIVSTSPLRTDFTMQLWWSAGDDFELGNYLGIPMKRELDYQLYKDSHGFTKPSRVQEQQQGAASRIVRRTIAKLTTSPDTLLVPVNYATTDITKMTYFLSKYPKWFLDLQAITGPTQRSIDLSSEVTFPIRYRYGTTYYADIIDTYLYLGLSPHSVAIDTYGNVTDKNRIPWVVYEYYLTNPGIASEMEAHLNPSYVNASAYYVFNDVETVVSTKYYLKYTVRKIVKNGMLDLMKKYPQRHLFTAEELLHPIRTQMDTMCTVAPMLMAVGATGLINNVNRTINNADSRVSEFKGVIDNVNEVSTSAQDFINKMTAQSTEFIDSTAQMRENLNSATHNINNLTCDLSSLISKVQQFYTDNVNPTEETTNNFVLQSFSNACDVTSKVIMSILLDIVSCVYTKSTFLIVTAITRFVIFISTIKNITDIIQTKIGEFTKIVKSYFTEDTISTQGPLESLAGIIVFFASNIIGYTITCGKQHKTIMDYVKSKLTDVKTFSFGVQVFNFFKIFISSLKEAVEYIYTYFDPEYQSMQRLVSNNQLIEKFVLEVGEIVSGTMVMVHGSPAVRNKIYTNLLLSYKLQQELVKYKDIPGAIMLRDVIKNFQKYVCDHFSDLAACPVRYEPFVLGIEGTPGIGKSYLTTDITKNLLESINFNSQVPENIFYRVSGEKYWSGYKNQPVVVYDEWFNVHDSQRANDTVTEIMQLKSTALFVPPMAAIEDKNTRCNPLFVVTLSNNLFPNITNIARSTEAVFRRRDIVIRAELKKEFVGIKTPDIDYEILSKFGHLQFRLYANAIDSKSLLDKTYSYEDIKTLLGTMVSKYHQRETRNVHNRIRSLPFIVNSHPEMRELIDQGIDPFYVFYNIDQEVHERTNQMPGSSPFDNLTPEFEKLSAEYNRKREKLITTETAKKLGRLTTQINCDPAESDNESEIPTCLPSTSYLVCELCKEKKDLFTSINKTTTYCVSCITNANLLTHHPYNTTYMDCIGQLYSKYLEKATNTSKELKKNILTLYKLMINPVQFVHPVGGNDKCGMFQLYTYYLSMQINKGGDITKAQDFSVQFEDLDMGVKLEAQDAINTYYSTPNDENYLRIPEDFRPIIPPSYFSKFKSATLNILKILGKIAVFCGLFVTGYNLVTSLTSSPEAIYPEAGVIPSSGINPSHVMKRTTKLQNDTRYFSQFNTTSDTTQDIISKVAQNFCILGINNSEGTPIKLNALGIFNRNIMLPRHYYDFMINTKTKNILINRNHQPTVEIMLSSCKTKVSNTVDICIMTLPSNIPQFKDIRKYFSTIEDFDIIPADVCLLIPSKNTPKIALYKMIALKCQGVVEHIEISSPENSRDYTIQECLQYNYSGKGDCGSLLINPRSTRPIMSMHVAGRGTGTTGYGYGVLTILERFGFGDEPVVTEGDFNIPDINYIEEHDLYFGKESQICYLEEVTEPIHICRKSKLIPSSIFGLCSELATARVPVILSKRDPRYSYDTDPFVEGCKKHGKITLNFPHEDLEAVTDFLENTFYTKIQPLIVSPKTLTYEEAITGYSELSREYPPLNLSKSVGYPVFTPHKTKKRDYVSLEDGKLIIDTNVVKYFDNCLELRRKGIRPRTIFVDTMKDEKKMINKVLKQGGTRIFCNAPFEHVVTVRRYYQHFIAAFIDRKFESYHGIGINVYGRDWSQLASYLMDNGKIRIATLDYSNFGPGFNAAVANECFTMVNNWVMNNCDICEEDILVLETVKEELINSYHIAGSLIYKQMCGSPSGSPFTSIINSLVNIYYVHIAWKRITNLPLPDFSKHVKLVVYGDDLIMGLTPEIADIYNSVTLQTFFAEYNMATTIDLNKSDALIPYTSILECSFLKRTFLPHPTRQGLFLASIDSESMKSATQYVWQSADIAQSTRVNCYSALLLAYGDGPKFFSNFLKTINKCLTLVNIEPIYITWTELDNMFIGDNLTLEDILLKFDCI